MSTEGETAHVNRGRDSACQQRERQRMFLSYAEINQPNALNDILVFLLQWLLHVSPEQCHPQGATMFLSEPLQRQYRTWRNLHTGVLYSYVSSVICPVTCLLPYWRWSGSERNTVAPWGWHCFAETCRSHRKRKIKYIIQCIWLVNLYVVDSARYKNQNFCPSSQALDMFFLLRLSCLLRGWVRKLGTDLWMTLYFGESLQYFSISTGAVLLRSEGEGQMATQRHAYKLLLNVAKRCDILTVWLIAVLSRTSVTGYPVGCRRSVR
jgi:hypothetical protein